MFKGIFNVTRNGSLLLYFLRKELNLDIIREDDYSLLRYISKNCNYYNELLTFIIRHDDFSVTDMNYDNSFMIRSLFESDNLDILYEVQVFLRKKNICVSYHDEFINNVYFFDMFTFYLYLKSVPDFNKVSDYIKKYGFKK